ncbi:MAG TPA: hypothetical protein VF107_06800, partial [Burkholderiaceae bacterium]
MIATAERTTVDTGLLPEVETMPRARLAALQLKRLRDTLTRVWHQSPWQRQRLQCAGLQTPQDLRELDDLRRLPFMV